MRLKMSSRSFPTLLRSIVTFQATSDSSLHHVQSTGLISPHPKFSNKRCSSSVRLRQNHPWMKFTASLLLGWGKLHRRIGMIGHLVTNFSSYPRKQMGSSTTPQPLFGGSRNRFGSTGNLVEAESFINSIRWALLSFRICTGLS